MRWLATALLCATAAVVFLVVETRSLAQQLGEREVALRTAQAAAAAAAAAAIPTPVVAPTQSPDARPADQPVPVPAVPAPSPRTNQDSAAADANPVTYAQALLELQSTKSQLAAVTQLLEQRNAEAVARAAQAVQAQAQPPMPEGVRACLLALHNCLHAEGYHGVRFLTAKRLQAGILEEVEVLSSDSSGLAVTFFVARQMTARLDRATGDLELRFLDGIATEGGVATKLPKDGHPLVLRGTDGRRIEARLPFLVRAEGVYPETVRHDGRAATDVDGLTRGQWLERFDTLLGKSGTTPKWRLNRFRGMQDGWFLECELVGTDDKKHVVASAHCKRLAVEVDPVSTTVSLRLVDGVLRRGAVESSIQGEGHRMLLPDLTIPLATETMIGMVVTK